MNQVDQNINKDMIDSDLIDVESLDFSDDQTWLYTLPDDDGHRVDVLEWSFSSDWPLTEDSEYVKSEKELNFLLDNLLKNDIASPDKHKFDSRTYVKPKKRTQRPSIQSIVEVTSNPPSITPNPSLNQSTNLSINQSSNKYLTYNKYNNPLGPISPMLRLKTFNVDANTDNSVAVKEYAMKRRSLVPDDDPQLEDLDVTTTSASERLLGPAEEAPINIDLSQPAHNLHNTFNKGLTNIMNERGSLNMYQSGEWLMWTTPPSLVSSLLESSGTFNAESIEGKKSMPSYKESGLPISGRESVDPMMTSMTVSILDLKDMSTSFLSQTTYPDNDSLIDSLPPSLVSSVNSSYVVNTSKPKSDSTDSNIFSSATFTHLEQSERLLSARPRCQLYNSYTKRDSGLRSTESYTKAREEGCQIDQSKILNENTDNKDTIKYPRANEMTETITLHYSNNKYKNRDAEKENMNATFEADDAFYKDNGIQNPIEHAKNSLNMTIDINSPLQKAVDVPKNSLNVTIDKDSPVLKTGDIGKSSLNVTLDKQELNEIKQARQKLSLARRGLPSEPDRPLPNQVEPMKTIQLPNQVITPPRQSMENVSELLAKRRSMNQERVEELERSRETPKRNATFRKVSPKQTAMDTTVVYVKDENQIIDINSATLNLIETGEKTLQQDDFKQEWGSQERAMVGSSESTDTGTFSSSSPPDSVPDTAAHNHDHGQIASTPLLALRKGSKTELLNLHTTISPIYDTLEDKSYTLTKAQSTGMERTYDLNQTVINTATMVKKVSAKRDILAGKSTPEKNNASLVRIPNRISPTNMGPYNSMAPPSAVPKKTGLPTSKLRQYSSHKELNRIAGSIPGSQPRALPSRAMVRRGVYASNPALSPTAPAPPSYPSPLATPVTQVTRLTRQSTAPAAPVRRDSYTVAVDQVPSDERDKSTQRSVPALVRQGTETLRRERPQSQLVAPRDVRVSCQGGGGLPVPSRYQYHHILTPATSRPVATASATLTRVSRPTSGPARPNPVPSAAESRPVTAESRVSALPRPSRLPAPRRGLRPPSVYSVAPTADIDHY